MAGDEERRHTCSGKHHAQSAEMNDKHHPSNLEPTNDHNTQSSPFAAFKRFVDDSFNDIAHSFASFPANIQEIKAKMQREQERWREEEQEISKRWTGSADSPDHIQMLFQRSSEMDREETRSATIRLVSESWRRNAHVPPEKIEKLFKDSGNLIGDSERLVDSLLALGGAWFYMPETGDKLPTADERRLRWSGFMPQWLSVDWFKRSPYSPITLEAHPSLGKSGAKWRAAFEDLLNATLDKPMDSVERIGIREPHGNPQSTYFGPGLDWMLSLQCRGILPPQLPRFYNDMSKTRALPEGSTIMDLLAASRKHLPWPDEIAHSVDPLRDDLSDLMVEIATESTSETQSKVESVRQFMPETELDMYDPPYLLPTATPSENPSPYNQPPAVALTGNFDTDFNEAEIVLWEALENNDPETAAQVLNEWHRLYQNVSDLIPTSLMDFTNYFGFAERAEWHPVLHEAFRQSNLPDSHEYKRALFDAENMSPEEKRLQHQIQKRGNEVAGRSLRWPVCTTEELLGLVQTMEDANRFSRRMTSEKKDDAALSMAQKPEPTEDARKPEVLSALTTTQTTRLPDGTVTTKVVLKKRFTDGREETTESVHTANENLEQQKHGLAEEPELKKKGWFWS